MNWLNQVGNIGGIVALLILALAGLRGGVRKQDRVDLGEASEAQGRTIEALTAELSLVKSHLDVANRKIAELEAKVHVTEALPLQSILEAIQVMLDDHQLIMDNLGITREARLAVTKRRGHNDKNRT